jgi:D-alanine-D-alanine ligase
MGITAESVVEDRDALALQLAAGLARFRDGMMIEEYVAGRDVVVPFLELVSPETGGILEPAEYIYPDANRRFAIFELDMKMRGFADVKVRVPARLSAEQRAEVMRLSRICIDVLGVHDLGRLDYRVDENGGFYFLEMNALPSLEPGASIYLSGQLAGLDGVEGVMERVIASAEKRYASL